MKLQIDVQNLQKQIPITPDQIASTVKKILRRERVLSAQLSIVFVTDKEIRALNKKYLKHDYATDVLAFNFLDSPKQTKCLKPKEMNAEIIISTGAVCRQAKIFNNSLMRELTLYVIHGIFHLLGFDDHRPNDIKRFRAKEEEILTFLKI